jgi:diacylglycerol kinase (ATP)
MRAAAILGPGNVARRVAMFQRAAGAQWTSLIEQADVLVIFGGDGTIHRHLSTLVDLETPLLVVPCGSGNDFARALGLRRVHDSVEAWRKYASGGSNVRTIDLGVMKWREPRPIEARPIEVGQIKPAAEEPLQQERHFCCVAGVGIDTEIARRANALPKWIRSHGGYGFSAPGEFLRFAPFPMKIYSSNGTAPSFQPTILAAFANTPGYGGGMRIAPQAKLDDGKLDICIVRAMNKFKLFCMFPTVYFGGHLGFEEVEYDQAATAKLETEHPLDVYADGEFVCQTPVEISVASNALKVIVP